MAPAHPTAQVLLGLFQRPHARGKALVAHHVIGQIAHRVITVALLLYPAVKRAPGRFACSTSELLGLNVRLQDVGRVLGAVTNRCVVAGRALKALYCAQRALAMRHSMGTVEMVRLAKDIALRAVVHSGVAFILIAVKITARPTWHRCWRWRWRSIGGQLRLAARLGELRPVAKAVRLRDLVLRLVERDVCLLCQAFGVAAGLLNESGGR